VFALGFDPVAAGFISNIQRPDNNITGASSFGLNLAPKRVELLHEFIGSASKLGFLINPSIDSAQNTIEARDIEAAGHVFGWQLLLYKAAAVAEFEPAFEAMVRDRINALIIATDTFLYSQMGLLGSLAERYALPAIGPLRDFPAAGGLMSYSSSIPNTYRQAGIHTGKVLKGAKPADLPFFLPTRFELVINLKAAKALGLAIPMTLQVAADEVIE
jgi:putative ABC transport system substrate-binding protein